MRMVTQAVKNWKGKHFFARSGDMNVLTHHRKKRIVGIVKKILFRYRSSGMGVIPYRRWILKMAIYLQQKSKAVSDSDPYSPRDLIFLYHGLIR